MRDLRKFVQRVGLMSTLLIGGVVGGLLTPVQSEAQIPPTVTIGGTSVAVDSISCPSGYNSCWVIRGANNASGATYSGWIVKDISSTNRARVLINDQNTTGSVDKMRFSGVNLAPVDTTQTTKSTEVVITYRYTAGQPVGDYVWAEGMSGVFDPPSSETIVGDRVKLVGTGTFPNPDTTKPPTVASVGTVDTGIIQDDPLLPWSNDQNGSITKSLPATVVLQNCNTGNNVCTPTIEYKFTVTSKGGDALVLNDSVVHAHGTCREVGPVPSVPLGPPSPLPPGPVCKGFISKVNQVVHQDALDGMKFAKGINAMPVTETCLSGCGGGTIIITKTVVGTGAPDGTFGFSGTGEDMPAAFTITTTSGTGNTTFSPVSTGTAGGVRVIDEVVFPLTDSSHYWTLESVTCHNEGGPENGTNWTEHYGGDEDLVGVKVNNLADGDTLGCLFTNRYNTIIIY